MKVIKFFCLIGLLAIIASAVAENSITESSFFRQYLDQSVENFDQGGINTSDIPAEVMESFMQSPYKDLSIHEVQKIEKYDPFFPLAWIEKVVPFKTPKPEAHYVLSLGDHVHHNVITIVSFDYKGKLLAIKNM